MIYIYRAVIALQTPLHCGGGEENGYDQPVIRDAFGEYRIPGSSIAGILRSHARCCPESDASIVDRAFGFTRPGVQDSSGESSLVWCADAGLLDFDDVPTLAKRLCGESVAVPCGPYIREHVRIDTKSGAGEKGGKFDEEYVPVGSRFALELILDGWTSEPEEEVKKLFFRLCAELEAGKVRFGAKSAEGFGAVSSLYSACRRFDLSTEKGLESWLKLEDGPRFADGDGERVPLPQSSEHSADTQGINGELTLPFVSNGPLLIGGGSGVPDASGNIPDMNFYNEPFLNYEQRKPVFKPVLPGSSFRGVLRHRVLRVAQSLGANQEEAQQVLDRLFGHAGTSEKNDAVPGKISVHDAVLDAAPTTVQHVAIDRFTGGALDGALYSEAPLWRTGLSVLFRLQVRELCPIEAGLLLHALLDMAQGELPVGGGHNRGNGFLRLDVKNGKLPEGAAYCLNWGPDKLAELDGAQAGQWLEKLDVALQAAPWRQV